jgi:hypothetical protein
MAECSLVDWSVDVFRSFVADSQCLPKATFPLEQLSIDQEKIVLPAPVCGDARVIDLDEIGPTLLVLDEQQTFLVTREQLPGLLEYARTHDVVLEHGGGAYAIRPNHHPLFYVDSPQVCSPSAASRESCYGTWLVAALEQVRYSDRRLVIGSFGCPRDRLIDESEIVSAEITFPSSQVPDQVERGRPTWGIGANVGGPAVLLSLTYQAFPVDRLALEAGLVALAPGAIGVWSGARVAVVRFGSLSWYLGGFGHASIAGGSSDPSAPEEDRGLLAAGPRLGLEYVFPSKRHALSAEFDLVHASAAFVGSSRRNWTAWGGVGYVYLF